MSKLYSTSDNVKPHLINSPLSQAVVMDFNGISNISKECKNKGKHQFFSCKSSSSNLTIEKNSSILYSCLLVCEFYVERVLDHQECR